MKTFKHTNSKFLHVDGCLEGSQLQEAVRLQTKTNYANVFRKSEAEKCQLANLKADYKKQA